MSLWAGAQAFQCFGFLTLKNGTHLTELWWGFVREALRTLSGIRGTSSVLSLTALSNYHAPYLKASALHCTRLTIRSCSLYEATLHLFTYRFPFPTGEFSQIGYCTVHTERASKVNSNVRIHHLKSKVLFVCSFKTLCSLSWPSCLSLLSAGILSVHYYIWLKAVFTDRNESRKFYLPETRERERETLENNIWYKMRLLELVS